MTGWIAVDLDGTLAEYHGWIGPLHIGPPIPLMAQRVKRWLAEGKDVRVFTARVHPDGDDRAVDQVWRAIEDWCLEHLGARLPVTHEKDYGMVELWDDRAVQVISNTGLRADGADA